MASSSPVSFRSQVHNYSPTQASNQDFRSQVPFHTQLPYDCSPSEARKGQNLSPVPAPTPKCLPRASKVNTKSQGLRTSRRKSNASSGKFSDAEDLYQSHSCRADVSEDQPATVPGEAQVEDEDEVTSSDESIECVPLGTNLGQLNAESSVEAGAVDLSMSAKQPFPLVEWIRRIREESKPEWPTLPLKWSRSISKQQRKILDDEDAWYPPLPGQPVRQGTIPIDILKELTLQVDQDAERNANRELQHSLPHPNRISDKQTNVSQPQHLPSSPPSPSSIDEPDIPWSSSPSYPAHPPRRQLPPDTSPPRPASNRVQELTAANETLREANQAIPLANKPSANPLRKAAQTPPSGPARIRSTQNNPARREGGKEAESINRVSRITDTEVSTRSRERSRTSPLREDLPLTSSGRTSRLPGTVSRSRPKIQVKDTPHPAKSLTRDRERLYTNGYIPESSLVPATYPEAAMPYQRTVNSPERDSSSLPHSQPARMTAPQAGTQSIQTKSQQAERPLKRTFDQVDQVAHTVVARLMSSHRRDNGPILDRANNGPLETQPDEGNPRSTQRQSRQAAIQSPTSSEYKAEEQTRVRNKELLDEERLENRRAFRASIATSVTRGGVKYVLASTSKAMDENARAISAALSSPKSHGPTLAGSRSEDEETSATNLSLHDTSRPTKPPGHTTPRQTLVQVAVNTDGLEGIFQVFTRTYPDYLGSLKNFESALRLLVKLRSKPHEPHPSLWDDFVFRMAGDYKAYLQECIDEAESALPYQDFYYSHIKQSEHRSGIITEEGIKIATSSTMKTSTPPKRTNSNLLSHDDVVMVDADAPKSQPSQLHGTRPTVDTVQDLQTPRDHRPPSRAAPTSIFQQPDKVPTNEPSTQRSHTNKTAKRHSMPWTDNKSNKPLTDTVMLQTQQILASSGEQTNTTTAVEQWLSRPAGACSPEIELTQIQAPDQEVAIAPSLDTTLRKVAKKVADSHVQDSDLSRLHLPGYLASQKATPAKDNNQSPDPQPSVTASEITAQAERPVTPFTLFARNFANLQSEKSLRGPPGSKKKLPINVYKW